MGKWVDFKEIKQKITMQMVLGHYGLLDRFKLSAKGLRGCCPIHGGSHPNQFHVDLVKNTWNCFGGCDMEALEGHVIGFVSAMEKVGLREAALLLAEWFEMDTAHPPKNASVPAKTPQTQTQPKARPETTTKPKLDPAQADPENPELSFRLKTLASTHPYLEERGLPLEAVRYFGIGFCSRGMFKGRIVFPLHRPPDGKLIGYTGRTLEPVTEENPKWLLPSIIKPKLLFNFHQVQDRNLIIVVEGCFGAIRVWQAGFPNVVALLGKDVLADNRLSYDQLRLLAEFQHVVLLLDGDPDGRAGAERSAAKLAESTWVRIVTLPDGKDPADFAPSQLQSFLSFI